MKRVFCAVLSRYRFVTESTRIAFHRVRLLD
jgi:hypothetical protein